MNRIALLVSSLLISPVYAASTAWLNLETSGMHKITGLFVQNDFGFSIQTPSYGSAYVTNGGDSNNGVRVILGEQRVMDVYPEYIDSDFGNMEPCSHDQFPWEKTGTRIDGTARLGTQTVCENTVINGSKAWSVIQGTGEDRGQGIMYTLMLTTTRQALQHDLGSLHQIASTFKRVPIDP